MTNFFSEPSRGAPIDAPGADFETMQPPTAILLLMVVEVIVALALLPVGSKAIHIVGYAFAAVFLAGTSVLYRSVDRTRRRSRFYVVRPMQGRLVIALLIVGVAVAALHAYFIARHQVLAK